jgi:sugar O-acyltransferase (sialic acid O-acetyltransferase NeuD family)
VRLMDRLIIGAGGFGREVRELVRLCHELRLVGFLADAVPDPSTPSLGAPLLGPVDCDQHRTVPCVVAVGYPKPKRAVVTELHRAGRVLASPLVHPRSELGSDVQMEDGVIVTAGVVATTNVSLGMCVSLHPGALLGHDVTCGAYTSIMPGASVSGNVTLGEGVFVGTNAAILQGVSVGPWATVGAGAVVTKDVAAGTTVVGVPARPLR